MHQGNWTCSGCGGAITELPFEPRNTAGLKCKSCFAKGAGGNGGNDTPRAERTMHKGDWKCAGCGGAITELPFQPRDTGNLKCLDCFKKERS
ncbi:MAG: hypothetical protein OQJ98_00345 [Candidatus Pacebacteria bacterium]|nr:hypothetical protein [Candidatus Paceibacterota bacterium]